jgi:3-phenylpropionate/trans-cinnamate dioxygenase ferredoxin reductase subunit
MPNNSNYKVKLQEHTLSVAKGQTILDAALMAGIDYPHSCQVGSCSTCRCVLLSGNIRELTDFAYVLTEDEIEAGVILACQSSPKSDLIIQFAQ